MVWLGVVAAAVPGSAGAEPLTTGYFRCAGSYILDPQGNPFQIRGNGLSGWLTPEAYILRLNAVHYRHIGSTSDLELRIRDLLGNDEDAQAFWDLYRSNFVTRVDIENLAAAGFNTIRIPFNYRLLSPWGQPGVFKEEGFQVLDQALGWCRTNGLAVILDLHAAPGGQSGDPPVDPEHTYWTFNEDIQNWLEKGVACLWESNAEYYAQTGRTPEFNQARLVDIWRTIAGRYRDEPALLGYELLNEPFLPFGVHAPELRDLLMRITAAIREEDTNHIVFIEGNFYASSFEGMTPLWDDNAALMFHKYWRPTTYSEIQPLVETAESNNVPLVMGESGENSSSWFYEFRQLLEEHHIGWCWWGFKKVDSITAAYSALVTPAYQYVIDNFRDLPVDPALVKQGLMEMAGGLASDQCRFEPSYFASLLQPDFGGASTPYAGQVIPGVLDAVHYDLGEQGVAYYDTRAKNEENYDGAPWNQGWAYRNDGVDILPTAEGNGFKIGYIDDGEWTKYSVNVLAGGLYDVTLRVASASSDGRIQIQLDEVDITPPLVVPDTGGWENWQSLALSDVYLPAGPHRLIVQFVHSGFDLASLAFYALPLDGDDDGMFDYWEIGHFGTRARLPGGDEDGDGVNNRDEFLADSEPNDPHSFLTSGIGLEEPGFLRLRLELTSSNRWYTLYRQLDPVGNAPWLTLGLREPGTGGPLVFSLPEADTGAFYRVGAELP